MWVHLLGYAESCELLLLQPKKISGCDQYASQAQQRCVRLYPSVLVMNRELFIEYEYEYSDFRLFIFMNRRAVHYSYS